MRLVRQLRHLPLTWWRLMCEALNVRVVTNVVTAATFAAVINVVVKAVVVNVGATDTNFMAKTRVSANVVATTNVVAVKTWAADNVMTADGVRGFS